MSASVEEQREHFGVERIRRTVGVTTSAYRPARVTAASVRAVEDERLLGRIVRAAKIFAYGPDVERAAARAGEHLPRCRVQRLMAAHGIQGAKRRREARANHEGPIRRR